MPIRTFSFLSPLAAEIWAWVVVAYLMVSFTIWLVAHFSPKEWYPAVTTPCSSIADFNNLSDEDELLTPYNVLENEFTLANSLWFTLGSLMQQGSMLNPKVCFYIYISFYLTVLKLKEYGFYYLWVFY